MVQTKNLNSTFQPFERISEHTYFICVIVKLSEDFMPTELMTKLLSRNCKILKLSNLDTVDFQLDNLN